MCVSVGFTVKQLAALFGLTGDMIADWQSAVPDRDFIFDGKEFLHLRASGDPLPPLKANVIVAYNLKYLQDLLIEQDRRRALYVQALLVMMKNRNVQRYMREYLSKQPWYLCDDARVGVTTKPKPIAKWLLAAYNYSQASSTTLAHTAGPQLTLKTVFG